MDNKEEIKVPVDIGEPQWVPITTEMSKEEKVVQYLKLVGGVVIVLLLLGIFLKL